MEKVEQNDTTGNQEVAMLNKPSQPEKFQSHPPDSSLDVQTMRLPSVKKVEAQKVTKKDTKSVQQAPRPGSKRTREEARILRIRCKQLCVSIFFQGHPPVHSLGFTSAISGEGKSFLAHLAAEVMTEDDNTPVTLLECNWEHPSFNTTFNLPPGPGLAEWLFGECSLAAIRRQVSHNLTIIPAGNSKNNAIGLLRNLQQRGTAAILSQPNEVLIVDLPPITTTTYGQLAAGLVDALILVVRMGVTPEGFITEANSMLKELPVHGVIFNQVKSPVPHWLRQVL